MTHRSHKTSDHCDTAGKHRYRDAREATHGLHTLRNRARVLDELGLSHTIRVVRKYECPACKGWHLTSWPTPAGPATPTDALISNLARSTGLGFGAEAA